MFFISLPLAVKVGDTVECKFNGKPKQVTWRDAVTLVIEPSDARVIVDVRNDGTLRHFTCSNSDEYGGTEGITIIG
jgi:hypothetical protein